MSYKTVIIADGSFPVHEIPLGYIRDAERIVCCDGSTENLIAYGLEPNAIVGDMDSISEELANRFADRLFLDNGQETNDLTKAVTWCKEMGYRDIAIVGATGIREDHTIGNISLLAEYCADADLIMVTDTGTFKPYPESSEIISYPGQQVSIFSIDPEIEITSHGLKYPLEKTKLKNWWCGTLNESLSDVFSLHFNIGRLIVFLRF